jgi:uncharacterized membrane protein
LFILNFLVGAVAWLLSHLIALAMIVLWIFCIWDCFTRRFRDPTHKWLWLAGIIVLPIVGCPLYLMLGREQGYRY